jgi:nucleoside-diphosphate-sugar epimerase
MATLQQMFDVRGKSVIVTGGASGIGRAYAEVMVHNGARVCILDIDQAALDVVVGEIGAGGGEVWGQVVDVTDRPRIVAVGLCVGGDEWDPFAAISKEIQVIFAGFFTMAEFATAIDALGPGRFRPQALITDRISFLQTPETFEALKRRTTQCKVLIDALAG